MNMSQENTKTNETYQLKYITTRNDETTPLTRHEDISDNNVHTIIETSGLEEKLSLEKDAAEAAKTSKRKTLVISEELLQNKNALIITAFACFILILLSTLIIFKLISKNADDRTYRFIRIVPKPKGPTNLIYYRHGDLKKESGIRSWPDMVKEIDTFLAPYFKQTNTSLCLVNNRDQLPEDSVCKFDINTIDKECLKPDYGYMTGSPCIFIVFNNIPDWAPENQTDTTGIVEMDCTTNTQFDTENIGPMEFTPFQGFQSIYFPYKKQANYMPPFVALRLPAPTQNVGIGITCRFMPSKFSMKTDDDQIAGNNPQEPVPYIPFNIFIE